MAEPTKSYYAIIPADVRYDDNLSANAKLLYGELTCLCNEKGYCWATNGYFANLYGVSKVTVSRWINQLREQGYIKVDLKTKDNTTMEQARHISIVNTPYQKCYAPLNKNDKPPLNKNVKDNNTSNNNTNITIPTLDCSLELKDALESFAEHRKKLKKPMTDYAKYLTLNKLKKLASAENEQIAILNQSIERGWSGVFPLKGNTNIDTGNDQSSTDNGITIF